MARRWEARSWGSPEGWELVEVEVPKPRSGEVTIRVRAAGVNPADYKHVAVERAGTSLPVPIGYEVSGVIAAIGPGTRIGSGEVAVGDEVVAFRVQGGYATALTVAADKVFAKPASLSHEAAANLLLAGTTASEMLHVTGVTAGDTILVHGASGAVGVSLLQQAAAAGARVIGTASPSSFDRVRRYGGLPVAYGPGLVGRIRDVSSAPIVAALDTVGTDEAVDASLQLVGEPTRIVTIVASQRAANEGFHAIAGSRPESAAYRDRVRGEVVALAGSGLLEVPVARAYPLAEAREALRLLAGGHPGGKIALLP
ncbi:NADP-dependent oxidoreductase [Microbacterium sulfonylureivorans]|uniref:NADP-dependent oxidoreductase n=1 Tax=Microbacterium sulfonylureivorans TaxID=2486854 RepID=UPI000FDA61CF|nr:NADP-dependent oxidoreductase [Microbacterium sulfonylureivorans]